ncbi:hypothetical protein ACH4E8_13940 [Streptomyces sp. NPDC017979]|uniref:hypothetical protein n=1 Tax=Streptomyces sp. NPDC017979 TaxID=3365024 RepID=UPI0037A87F2D
MATPADLVDRMHQLKVASGLTYRQISDRAREAGDFLPSSTLAGALARHTLPRAELVAAFVRACTDDEQTVQSWTRARNALTLRTTPTPRRPPTAPDPGAGPSSSPAGHRRAADHGRRPLLAFVLGALFAATVSRAVTRSPQRFADGVPEAA